MSNKGLVHIYTGNGKGKTTAAMGLALRAAGWRKNVIIYQFLKPPSLELGERKAIGQATLSIKIEAVDIEWNMAKSFEDKIAVENARAKIEQICNQIKDEAKQKKYDIIVLDEIVFCLSKKLAQIEWIKDIIESKESSVELVLTGRGASDELVKLADIVTEMKEIKHPFNRNIKARKGIEY
ncbi:MAG: cob(I)yrinic acid a,c-diamide adenosyltransferase [Sedimentisphaerales bacterium]|nr:cob(I)yrinic acid a,c-diamide adenosyltransferase [Sedimentisphaerales bacterium]